jgi:hypothetical protein
MEPEERAEKFTVQTQALYSAIGRFAVQFEHLVHCMQRTVLFALQRAGLKDQSLAHALLAGQTADPTRQMFQAVVATVFAPTTDQDVRILRDINRRVADLVATRNDVLHRTWMVGWASPTDTDFSVASSIKFKNTKAGAEFVPREHSAEDFDHLSEEAIQLNKIISRLSGCVVASLRPDANFILASNGTVELPPGTDPGA